MTGSWGQCLPAYKAIQTELSECDDVIMRGQLIVMPTNLRSNAVKLAHEGHQRVTKKSKGLELKCGGQAWTNRLG